MIRTLPTYIIRIISTLILTVAVLCCHAAEPPLALADNAPTRHIVVQGDTLWSIAGTFLKEPWRWSELWRMNNDQIKNPHRIFPGDVIVLEKDADGNPRLVNQTAKLQPRIYDEQIDQAIPSIPPNVINPFLSSPLIIEANGFDKTARIVATQQDRVFLVNGDLAYVTNADPKKEKWQVYRKGVAMRDPESKEILGYEAYYVGSARQVQPGDPAIFEILTMKEEIGRGDRLVPAVPPPLISYVPHKPTHAVDARIISIYGGVDTGGRFSIVLLNKGSRDGIEIGHVLALLRKRFIVQRDDEDRKESVRVPDERYGLAFVFRTFDRLSYALIVQSEGPATINDYLQTP